MEADAIAERILEASGGLDVWEAAPFVRFNVLLRRGREARYTIKYLYDKKLGIVRIEMPGPAQEPYVAVFYQDDFTGKIYWNGSELIDKDAETMSDRVRNRYYLDSFFFSAPFMLFEPGVTREYLEDLSNDQEAVLRVNIPHWGVPSNTFLFYTDRETGRLTRTSYKLPNGNDAVYLWQDYEAFTSLEGTLYLSTRKRGEGIPFAWEYSRIGFPRMVGHGELTSPQPILHQPPEVTELEETREGQ